MKCYIADLCTQPHSSAGSFFLRELIGRGAVPVNLIVPNGVAVLAHRIAGVAFYGVDAAILNFLHNTHMVGLPVLTSIIQVKEDDVAGARLVAVVLPQPTLLEPGNTLGRAGRKLRDNAGFNIAALIGAPAHKAGAPFHTAAKTIPAPVRFAADIPHLGERHRNDLAIPSGNAVEHLGSKGFVLISQQLRHLFPLVLVKADYGLGLLFWEG